MPEMLSLGSVLPRVGLLLKYQQLWRRKSIALVPEASLDVRNRLDKVSEDERAQKSEVGLTKANFTASECFAKGP